MNIIQFPLARVTIAFVGGILLSAMFDIGAAELLIMAVAGSVLLTVSYYFSFRDLIQRQYFGIAVFFVSALVGCCSVLINSGVYNPRHYIHHIDSNQYRLVDVLLRERLKPTAINEKFVVCVERIDGKMVKGNLLVNFRAGSKQDFQIGSRFRIRSQIDQFDKPLNPYQFDYGGYLKNKSIYAQAYVNDEAVVALGPLKTDIWYYSDRIRNTILENLKNSNFGHLELAVLSALILGQQQDISKQVLRDYQYAGAVHILSVSGLHVGFILLFLNFILKVLPNTKCWSYVRVAAILISLWGFAVLAGLSPSVVRSVTMFSFVAVGMHLRRTTNIFHTLLVSMLLILLCKPSFIFDVGFQLSYVALFFILWLQPILAELWKPRSKIKKYFWDILTVSFAAQIGAFPLSVYYFHQFPGLFFITNLVVIPFLSVIMALGVIAMLIAAFGQVPETIAFVLENAISLLNSVIHWIASLEDFVFKEIPYNAQLLLVTYLAILTIGIWYQRPSYPKATTALISVIVLQLAFVGTIWHHSAAREFVVLNIRKKSVVIGRNGNQAQVYLHENVKLSTYEDALIQSYLTANFIKKCDTMLLSNILFEHNKNILVLDSIAVYPNADSADIVILTQSPKLNLDRMLQTLQPEIIIADGSNFKSFVKLWKQTCENKKIPFHATAEKGPFIIN